MSSPNVGLPDLDFALTAQLLVAWAGEAAEDGRLGWWRTELVSEFGGEDLFQRLLPHTWRWAVLQGALEAARRRDGVARSESAEADRLCSLFHLGPLVDERLDQRLQDLKRGGLTPTEALPGLSPVLGAADPFGAFQSWLQSFPPVSSSPSPVGRRLPGAPPSALRAQIEALVAGLRPLGQDYPLVHYRRSA